MRPSERKWSRATVVVAAVQALSAYGYSALFLRSSRDYRLLFIIATSAIVLRWCCMLSGVRVMPARLAAPSASAANLFTAEFDG